MARKLSDVIAEIQQIESQGGDASELRSKVEATGYGERLPPMPQPEPQIPDPMSNTRSAVQGFGQGATFGSGDELAGVLGASMEMLGGNPNNESFGDLYDVYRDSNRELNQEAQQTNPWMYGVGELAGGIAVPGAGGVKAGQAVTKAIPKATALTGLATAGAVEGGIAGAGYSDGEDLVSDILYGAGTGAIATPALSGIGNYVGRGLGNIAGGFKRRLVNNPEEQAALRVNEALFSEGLTDLPSVRGALDELGPEGRLADLGPVLQNEAVVASKVQGPGRANSRRFLEERQAGQEGRLAQSARDELDPKWDSYRGYLNDLREQGKTQAGEAYDAAYKVDIGSTPELNRLSQTPVFQNAAQKAQTNIRNKLDRYGGGQGVRADGKLGTEMFDQIGREMRDMAEAAARQGNREQAGDINKIRRAMLDEVYKQNPDLQRAMSIYRGKSSLEDAAEFGRDLLQGRRVRVDELEDAMSDWSRSENEAFNIGLVQGIFDKLEDATTTQNSAGRLVNSSRVEKLLESAFRGRSGASGAADRFLRAVDAEKAMQDTRNRVVGGSPTFELYNASQNGPDLVTGGGVAGMVERLIRWIGKEGNETLSPADYDEIAKLMFKDLSDEEIQKLLAPTMRQQYQRSGASAVPPALFGLGASQALVGDEAAQNLF